MTQLRLAYSKSSPALNENDTPETRRSKKKFNESSITLPTLQLLSWKIERLYGGRPAAIEVLERIVDHMLDEMNRLGC